MDRIPIWLLCAVLMVFSMAGIAVMTPSPGETIRIAEEAGYSDVRLHGYAPLACSEDDLFRQRFTAVGPTGKTVSGVICSAPLKGSTIRLTSTSVFSGG